MMEVKLISFCVLLCLINILKAYAREKCTPVDISIIVEIDKEKRTEIIRETAEFFKTILYQTNFSPNCKRVSITVADHEVVDVKPFHCKTLSCGIKAVLQFTSLEDKEAKPTDLSPKENLIAALSQLETKNPYGNPGKHIVLVILTSPQREGTSVSDKVKTYIENGYRFIALGVGEGRAEDLNRITYSKKRVVKMKKIEDINDEQNEGRMKIMKMLDDPNALGPTDNNLISPLSPDFDFYEFVDDSEICRYVTDIVFLIDSSMSIKFNYLEELRFVSRIAARFDISEVGSHAAAVVFSDHIPYTKVLARLNESKSTRFFQRVVSKSPFIGYRTRIDLAFELVTTDIFKARNGARPNIKKAIVLLTDGRQNPKTVGNMRLDPVAASKDLYEKGVKIFAVGIGTDIDKKQLEGITRVPDRIFYTQNFEKLLSLEFVKNVSKRICIETGELESSITDDAYSRTLTDEDKDKKLMIEWAKTKFGKEGKKLPKKKKKQGKKGKKEKAMKKKMNDCKEMETDTAIKSSKCCPTNQVYINIFQPNSGPTYVLQGMKLQKSTNGKQLTAIKQPIRNEQTKVQIDGNSMKLPISNLIKIIKQALPEQEELATTIEGLLQKYGEGTNDIGVPAVERNTVGTRRKRTSRGRRSLKNEEDPLFFSLLQMTGCKKFLEALHTNDILQNITSSNRPVIIFCPLDDAIRRLSALENNNIKRDLFLRHIAFKHGVQGSVYQSMLPKCTITMKSFTNKENKQCWKANDVTIKASFTDGNNDIHVMEDVIATKRYGGVLDVLKFVKNCSVFYEMLLKSGTDHIFTKTAKVKEICFTHENCVPLTEYLQKHLNKAANINGGQFTIIAPVNSALERYKEIGDLASVVSNSYTLREFIKGHVFLGKLDNPLNSEQEIELAYSLSNKHSILVASLEKNTMVLKSAMNRVFKVNEKIAVREGTLFIVDAGGITLE